MATVTKLEAARRQLVTAIQLFFDSADSVSVFTLAHAAKEVLDRLCHHQGKTTWEEHIVAATQLAPEKVRELANYGKNFFKHADRPNERQPDAVLEDFSDARNDGILFCAVRDYAELEPTKPVEIAMFELWYLTAHPPKKPAWDPVRKAAELWFGALANVPRNEQKARGRAALERVRHEPELMNHPFTDRSPSGSI